MSAGDKNKFDDLFKHGLDTPEGHFEFDEGDWDNMEGLLPGKKKAAKVFALRNWAVAASVLVALALGWWFLKPQESTKQQVTNVPRSTVKKDSLVTDRQVVKPTVEQTIIGSIPTNNKTLADASGSNKQTISDATKKTQHIDKTNEIGINKDKQLVAQNTLQQNTTVQQKDSSTVGQAQIGDPAVIAVVAQQPVSSATTNGQVLASTDNDEPKENAPAVTLPKKNGSSVGKGGPLLAVSVILSPNFNGVGSLKETKMGKTAGLLFSVGVGSKLTIGTGAVYHQVPYTTAYSNYISTYKFSTEPMSVMADCRVLDIPLNIDYKVYHKGKNAFNVGVGLSSYFMLKEAYTYEFSPGHAYGPTGFTVDNKNKHILGVLDLSTTYQRKLNNKFSVGLQPYLKLPLTDIGNNRVRLQTAGIALTASWTIINKNP